MTSGPTARPTLPGRVHGVVVQARIDESSSVSLNFTYTDGSSTYTMNNIYDTTYSHSTTNPGNYAIVLADDVNDCDAGANT